MLLAYGREGFRVLKIRRGGRSSYPDRPQAAAQRQVPMLTIDNYHPNDAAALMRLFHETVHATCAADYAPEQLAAWSPASNQNIEIWSARLAMKRPFVARLGLEAVGFIELEADGHIDCLYVHHRFQRQGVATRLLMHAISQARERSLPRLYVEASITALPFFVRHGFSTLRAQEVERGGQRLKNFAMERFLEERP
jgi:putative acetyltransferase